MGSDDPITQGPLGLLQRLDPADVVELLEREYIHRLVFGNMVDVREIWIWTRQLSLPQPPAWVILAEIDGFTAHADSLSEGHRKKAKAEAVRQLQAVTRGAGCLLTPWDEGRIIGLYCARPSERDHEAQQRLSGLAAHMQEQVRTETGMSLSIGLSRQHKDSRQLATAYAEAVGALDAKFYAGAGSVLHSQEAGEPAPDQALLLRSEELQLLAAFRTGDAKSTAAMVTQCLQALERRRVRPARVRTAAADLVQLLLREVFDIGLDGDLTAAYQEQVAAVDRCEEFAVVVTQTVALAQELLSFSTGTLGTRGAADAIRRALWLIRTGYNRTLTLEALADRVGLSPSYLSRQFKAVVGQNFHSYLQQLRIEAAQRLLVNTDLAVGQIATRTGFQHQAHFTRQFREGLGVTPTEYRRQHGDPLRIHKAL